VRLFIKPRLELSSVCSVFGLFRAFWLEPITLVTSEMARN
jgi:hypothetical protein